MPSDTSDFIPFSRSYIGREEKEAVMEVLDSGWLTTGPRSRLFEEKVREYVGAEHAVALNSCTAALHLSLLASGIGPGDEVITTTLTFVSTVNMIVNSGARPVLVDINREDLNMDIGKIEESITPRTRAVIPVHFAGLPCDMDSINSLAAAHGLTVIEDAAHAIGAEYRGRKIGTHGDICCFSFYPTKNITTAEGGMAVMKDKALRDRIQELSLHGMQKDAWKRYSARNKWFYAIENCGWKYNITDIQSALGVCQIARLDGFLENRRRICREYDNAFSSLDGIGIIRPPDHVDHARHIYTITVGSGIGIGRDGFIKKLEERNIGSSVHFIPVHMHSFYRRNYGLGPFPAAEDVFSSILSIPLFPTMTDAEVSRVIDAVTSIAREYA